MEIRIESAGATRETARRAARAGRPEDAAAWARWTLHLEDAPPEGTRARARAWRLLTRGALVPPEPGLEEDLRARFGARADAAAAAVHRLQCAALAAEPSGRVSRLESDLARAGEFSGEEAARLEAAARRDLEAFLDSLARLFPEPDACGEGGPLAVSWTGDARPGRRCAFVEEGADGGAAFAPEPGAAGFVRDDAALAALARRLFGVASLRPGQAEAAAALLSGRDLSLAMPTGGGKSLPVHLAAALSDGTAVAVAPLRALLRDQRRRLAGAGFGRVGLLAGDDPESTRRGLAELESGRLLLCLAAPERLDSGAFRRALRGAAEGAGVPFVAVDEAQCAARRGPDWRPSYRALGARLRLWASTPERPCALAALTGAASPGAGAEAERTLGLREPARVRAGEARTNLSFRVWTGSAADHRVRLRELIGRVLPDGRAAPGLVFCPRVDGPLGAAEVAAELREDLRPDAAAFTGRAPAGAEPAAWDAEKRRAADEFLSGRRDLLVATRAFGLGVDRPDIRFVTHLGLPRSLEEYYQQAGRAGRDGLRSECWLVLHCRSERRARRWAALDLEDLRAELSELKAADADDVSRAYALHLAAFPGAEAERRDAELALLAAGDPSEPGDADVSLPGEDPDALTRALLVLEDAGALELLERRAAGWRVRRSGGWSAASALAAAETRIARDYAAVEPARRGSLAELIELALSPEPGRALAQRLAESAPSRRRYSASYESSAGPQEESFAIAVARAAARASGFR
jgi:hypothetical protein